jgi:hypothetical protein
MQHFLASFLLRPWPNAVNFLEPVPVEGSFVSQDRQQDLELLTVEYSSCDSNEHSIKPIIRAEFGKDTSHMSLYGVFGNLQAICNCFIGTSPGDTSQHLEFPLRKIIGAEMLRHFSGNLGWHLSLPSMYIANCLD